MSKHKKRFYTHTFLHLLRAGLIGGFLIYAVLAVYIGSHVYDTTAENADAIVILGARAKFGDRLNPCLTARLQEGARLFKRGIAPTVVVSGGEEPGGLTEAGVMKEELIKAGIPADAILTEDRSTSTYENLLFSRSILYTYFTAKNPSNIVLVSEPFHLPRARMIAQGLGLSASVSPALDSPCWTRWKFLSRYFLIEPIKYVNDLVKIYF